MPVELIKNQPPKQQQSEEVFIPFTNIIATGYDRKGHFTHDPIREKYVTKEQYYRRVREYSQEMRRRRGFLPPPSGQYFVPSSDRYLPPPLRNILRPTQPFIPQDATPYSRRNPLDVDM